jgi:hypothetical protein
VAAQGLPREIPLRVANMRPSRWAGREVGLVVRCRQCGGIHILKQEFEDQGLDRKATFRATFGSGTARHRHSMFWYRMI